MQEIRTEGQGGPDEAYIIPREQEYKARDILKSLWEKCKKGEFEETEEKFDLVITTRDVTEYVYTRQYGRMLRESAESLMALAGQEDPNVEAALTETRDKYTWESETSLPLSDLQVEMADNMIEAVTTSIAEFDAYIQGKTDGEILDGIYSRIYSPQQIEKLKDGLGTDLTIDKDTFPGVIAIRTKTMEQHARALTSEGNTAAVQGKRGVYMSPELSTFMPSEELRGHIIFLGPRADEVTERHEYMHYLNDVAQPKEKLPDIKDLPYQKEQEVQRLTAKETQLWDKQLRLNEALEENWKYTNSLNKELRRINKQLEQLGVTRKFYDREREKRQGTYRGEAYKAFVTARDEIKSYFFNKTTERELGGRTVRPKQARLPGKGIFGKRRTLIENPEDIDQLILAEDWERLRKTFHNENSTTTPEQAEDMAMTLAGARNFEQMAKFVYLYRQEQKMAQE